MLQPKADDRKLISSKLEELKTARTIASDIVDSGGRLYGLLGKEDELKVSRERALKFVDSLSLNLESNDPHELIEKNIREQINILRDNIADVERAMADYQKVRPRIRSRSHFTDACTDVYVPV